MKGKDKSLKIVAYLITTVFMVMILFSLLFLLSNSVKDNKKIYDFPPRFLPEQAKSLSIVLDYSDKDFSDSGQLKDTLIKDSVLALYSTTSELDRDSVSEIKFYGEKDGKVIYYVRAHKMALQMQLDYGLYANSVPTSKVLLKDDRYKAAAEDLKYIFNESGIKKNYSKDLFGKSGLDSRIGIYLKDKFNVTGKLKGITVKKKPLLLLENYKYYLQVPSLLYEANRSIHTFGFLIFIFNTILVTASGILIQIFVCSIAAYPLARLFKKRTANALLMVFLGCMMIPFISVMVPQFMMFKDMGLYNNYGALIIPWLIPHGLNVLLFKSFFERLPQSLFDAVRIDGATEWYSYIRICMPLSKSIISIIALSTFLSGWSDFFWPWMVAQKQNLWTLSVALYNLSRMDQVKLNFLMGTSIITILPVILLTIVFSDQIKQSLASSGIKG